jgi:ribosomal protein L37AE/L43A
MILKTRELPLNILVLEAIERRLENGHPKMPRIKELLAKYRKGHRGEHSIDYPLSIIPEEEYLILHNIRLQFQKFHFQIDTLLICSRFILLLEVKNFGGTIFFDRKFNQLIQTYHGNVNSYTCPIIQVSNQERLLRHWCGQHNFNEIPIISLVVISDPSSMIKIDPADRTTFQKVIHSHYLPTKIEQQKTITNKTVYSLKEMKKLARTLIKHHKLNTTHILRLLDIDPSEIKTGVQCPYCSNIPMVRNNALWHCDECRHRAKDAHIPALKDFFLIFNETITNEEAREFLHCSSPDTIKRILCSLQLPTSGKTKSRKYSLTPLIHRHQFDIHL